MFFQNHPSCIISAVDLLESKKVPLSDFHIHTHYTDGKASVKEVFEKEIEKKLETIIFTEIRYHAGGQGVSNELCRV